MFVLLDEVEAQLTVFLRRRHGDGPDLAVLAIRGTQDVHETWILEMTKGLERELQLRSTSAKCRYINIYLYNINIYIYLEPK